MKDFNIFLKLHTLPIESFSGHGIKSWDDTKTYTKYGYDLCYHKLFNSPVYEAGSKAIKGVWFVDVDSRTGECYTYFHPNDGTIPLLLEETLDKLGI